MARKMHMDYETFSEADLKSVGAWRYAFDPSTEILCCAFALDGEKPVVWHANHHPQESFDKYWDALEDPDVLCFAHNAQFEMAISAALMWKTWGIQPPALHRWRCTASFARRAALPAKLETLAITLGLTNLKDKRGASLIRKFSIMQPAKKPTKKNPAGLPPTRIRPEDDPAAFAEFLEYCRQDVVVEQSVSKRLAYFDSEPNNTTYSLDAVINARGVPVNLDALRHAQKIVDEETEIVSSRFRELTGFEITQNARLLSWLHGHGVHLDNLQAETVENFLESVPSDWPVTVAGQALQMKQSVAYASIKKIPTMLACAGPHDNRIRGMLNHHGATTGRWTASLVQFQNMKRSTIKNSGAAYRDICKCISREMLDLTYGPPLEVIGSCIRHFVHDIGVDGERPFVNADFAAVEARIVNWLAGQEDALEEYRQGADRYKSMASVIYGIPAGEVDKFPQRFVGKAAVLGCGFGMGAPKFRATCKKQGGYDMPIGLEDMAVKAFRAKHNKVVKFWTLLDNAAKSAVLRKGEVFKAGQHISFKCMDVGGMAFLLMRLPSGRKLAYPRPMLIPGKFEGTTAVSFYQNLGGVTWGHNGGVWGGVWAENCLAGATLVLSQDRGWVKIATVTKGDLLWDGVEFVGHGGLIKKGHQKVVDFHGILATPDHKFLTVDNKWVSVQTACTDASIELYSPHGRSINTPHMESPKPSWPEVWEPYSDQEGTRKREENHMDLLVQVWQRVRESWLRDAKKKRQANGVQPPMSFLHDSGWGAQYYTRDEQASSLPCVAEHERQMQTANLPCLAQLWREGHLCLRKVARVFREFLGGHGWHLPVGAGHRPQGQQWGLLAGELPVGNTQEKYPESEKNFETRRGTTRFLGCSSGSRHQAEHSLLSTEGRTHLAPNPKYARGFQEQVYDIINCGPRKCFAVKGAAGHVLIAHNCTQAVAMDLMANGCIKAEAKGYETATLIHDEALSYYNEAKGQTVEEFVQCLTDLPDWAAGLPLAAEGGLVPFYKKD